MWKDVGFLSGVVPVDLVDERDGREEEFLLGEVSGPAGGSGYIVYEVVISAEVVVLRTVYDLSLLFLAWAFLGFVQFESSAIPAKNRAGTTCTWWE